MTQIGFRCRLKGFGVTRTFVRTGATSPESGRAPTGTVVSACTARNLGRRQCGDATLAAQDRATVKWSGATTGTAFKAGSRTATLQNAASKHEEMTMAWTTPTLVEICIGLEINGYLPAEFW